MTAQQTTEAPLKIQLWMRHRDSQGHIKVYKTITGPEAAEIVRYLSEGDGTRPWEPSGREGTEDD